MNRIRNTVLAAMVVAASAHAAGNALLQMAMPGAKVLVGIHVEQGKQSPFGHYLLARLQNPDEGFRKFMSATGFDPRRDLTEIVFASADVGRRDGIVALQGVFDAGRIAGAVRQHGGTISSFRGVDLFTSGNPKDAGAVALFDATTAVAGNVDLVKAAIARRQAGEAPPAALMDRFERLGAANDFWFISLASIAELAHAIPDPAMSGAIERSNLFQAVTGASGGIRFGDRVVLNAQAVTRSDKDALALVDVVRFVAAMVQGNRAKDSVAAGAASVLDALVLRTEANVMFLSLSVPEAQVEMLLDEAFQHPAAATAAN